ncbi:hypothetical protein [Thermocrispum sp.]|uniref:Cell division protein FtsL n=2 Tax=Thermocrispum agreste TaxID=37925 RepID=A0ABD6FG51_9PSEU|nr:hypothetical protein [Thermocrispum sp.]
MTMVTTGTKRRSTKSARTTRRSASRTRELPARRNRSGRTTAAEKAYARRAQRTASIEHAGGQAQAPAGLLSPVRLRLPKSRASFVLLMMSLLAAGVGLTLWLTTQAIADSYRLDRVRAETAALSEKAERLQREVSREQTVAALDRKARELGMVPSGDPARILVTPMGRKKLIGEPTPAQPQKPPARTQSSSGGDRADERERSSGGTRDERRGDSRQNARSDQGDDTRTQRTSSRSDDDSGRRGGGDRSRTQRSESDQRTAEDGDRRTSTRSAGG